MVVLKARNLPKMDVTGLADPYVKIYLLYNGQRIAKKKTHVKKRTLSPVFNESFVFDMPSGCDSLDKICLEFLLLDWDRVTKNEVITEWAFTFLSVSWPFFHRLLVDWTWVVSNVQGQLCIIGMRFAIRLVDKSPTGTN